MGVGEMPKTLLAVRKGLERVSGDLYSILAGSIHLLLGCRACRVTLAGFLKCWCAAQNWCPKLLATEVGLAFAACEMNSVGLTVGLDTSRRSVLFPQYQGLVFSLPDPSEHLTSSIHYETRCNARNSSPVLPVVPVWACEV
jgi:hypothetical protein